MRYLLNLLVLIVFAVAGYGQTKMVVLSDTHVMAPELLISNGEAWQRFLNNDRKMEDCSRQLFDKMVERLKTEIKPQLVLITGDITKDGELVSHQYVAHKLDELLAAGIKTLVIPGNHDLGTRNAVSYDGEQTMKVATATMKDFAKIYSAYGYGDTSERENSTLTYVCEPISGLVMLGIDSGENGWLSNMTLNWICNKAEEAKQAGKQVVAMMHHPLFPHFYGVDKFVDTAVISNYENVRNRLADAGVGLIFTGHFHTSDIAKDFNGDLSRSIVDVNTGSLISYPCDYRVVTASADLHTWDIETASLDSLSGEKDFRKTSKERLTRGVVQRLSSMGPALELFAEDAAECFIIHAEGNENLSAKGQVMLKKIGGVLKEANGFASFMPSLTNKIKDVEKVAVSILKDISGYGITGRENQTNDRTLTVELP